MNYSRASLNRTYKELKSEILRSNFKNEQSQAIGYIRSNDWFEKLVYILEIGSGGPRTWDENMVPKILHQFGREEWKRIPLGEEIIANVKLMFSVKPILTAIQKRRATTHRFSIHEKTWKRV